MLRHPWLNRSFLIYYNPLNFLIDWIREIKYFVTQFGKNYETQLEYKHIPYRQSSSHIKSSKNSALQYHWWPKIFKVNSGLDISSKLVESAKTAHEAVHTQLMYTAFNKLLLIINKLKKIKRIYFLYYWPFYLLHFPTKTIK